MLSIMNQKTVYGLQNKFGGDSNFSLPSCSKENDAIVFEFEKENQEPYEDNGETYELGEEVRETMEDLVNITPNSEGNLNWKTYTPANLATPMSSCLKRSQDSCTETPSKRKKVDTSRRRPTTTVKALTSSVIGEKYNKLVDKRIAIADYQAIVLENHLKYESEEHEL